MFARARKGGADGKVGAHRRLGRCTPEEVIDAAGRDLRACKLHLWHVPRCRVCERATLVGRVVGRRGGVQVQLGGEAAIGVGELCETSLPVEATSCVDGPSPLLCQIMLRI